MPNKKRILIVTGCLLMTIGFFSALTAVFYEFKVKPEMAKRAGTSAASSAKTDSGAAARPQGVGVESLLKYSQGLYGADESNRREGTLWVDQEGKKLVVSLGALNGVKPQDFLTVYDHDLKIGRVQVISVFDVVSYVEKMEADAPMSKDYYKVVRE